MTTLLAREKERRERETKSQFKQQKEGEVNQRKIDHRKRG